MWVSNSFFEQIYINDTSSTIARPVSLWWESALGKTKEPSTVPVSLFRLRAFSIETSFNFGYPGQSNFRFLSLFARVLESVYDTFTMKSLILAQDER